MMSQLKISQTQYSRCSMDSQQSYQQMMRIPECYEEGTLTEYACQRKQTISNDIPYGIAEYPELYNKAKLGYSEQKTTSEIFSYIQTPVNYGALLDEQIIDERKQLESHLKFLNSQLSNILQKHIKMHKKSQNKGRKKNYNNQLSKQAEHKQIQNNAHLINLLENQFASLKKKLGKFENCTVKYQNELQINNVKQAIRKAKLDLIQRKRKLVLSQKKIEGKDTKKQNDNKIYFDLQQQFLIYTKKKDKFNKRLDELQLQNEEILDKKEKINHKHDSTTPTAKEMQKQQDNQLYREHLKALYVTHRRKLELLLRRRQREEEDYRRKYYNLLKLYEKSIENNDNLDKKIKQLQKEIIQHNKSYLKRRKILQSQSNQDNEQYSKQNLKESSKLESNEIQTENKVIENQEKNNSQNNLQSQEISKQGSYIDGFMLTQINQNTTKMDKKLQQSYKKQSQQQQNNQHQEENAFQKNKNSEAPKFHIRKYRTQRIKTEVNKDSKSDLNNETSIIMKIEDLDSKGFQRQWTDQNRPQKQSNDRSIVNVSEKSEQKAFNDHHKPIKRRKKRIKTQIGLIKNQNTRNKSSNFIAQKNIAKNSTPRQQIQNLHSKLKKLAVQSVQSESQVYVKNNGRSQPINGTSNHRNQKVKVRNKNIESQYEDDFVEDQSSHLQQYTTRRKSKKQGSDQMIQESIEQGNQESYEEDFDNFSP